MGRNSLVSIGKQAFEILILLENFSTTEIANKLDTSLTVVSKTKKELEDSGWFENGKITNSGKWFIKSIYLNEVISKKLK